MRRTPARREAQTLHGVFLDILGLGVLITGESGIGKSELALELLSRGHKLVADDAPEFERSADHQILGHAPALLRNFLEVRGLGILDVRAMFGARAIRRKKPLELVIRLESPPAGGLPHRDRLSGSRSEQAVLGVAIPRISLPVMPGHNLSVLVEAACRDHKLRRRGYSAAEAFAHRQAASLDGEDKS
ncbi:MAG: hypothetical protein ACRETN_14895 [Nevskiales bacterium]